MMIRSTKEPKAIISHSFDAIENFLLEECHDNDLVITMGAGDIYQVGEHLLGKR